MPLDCELLPAAITLSHGLSAMIELIPMPLPDARGRYAPRQDCTIFVHLFRAGELIERRRWDTLINMETFVRIADGAVLDEDDLYRLDDEGWDQMLKVGIVPTAFVG